MSAARAKEDAATTVTRERWLLPLFAELGFGRLQAAKAIEIDGRTHPVSHAWHHVPMHLIGCGVPLDTRTTGVAGAARTSPHALVQELLNRDEGMLWGVLSNGLTLRLLRDNRSLTRQAYVEFDLVAMMDGQAYADFVVLWLLCHQSRFEGGCHELGLPVLGSFLWRPEAVSDVNDCALANADLLDAVRALSFRVERNVRRPVDWRNLGPEELGSVYESLLELHADVNIGASTFTLRVAAGHERKTTGSYYTPTSLIECLLDSALDPVLNDAAKVPDAEDAILALKVCDPACGSGHFLIAAAHRISTRLAAVRSGDPEPAPEAVRTALRDVIGHCLYGVDINPMAVELCKINLWLEALDPGRPLSFLDHHIQCGNALLGATPGLLRRGIPDEAFDSIEGDDKAVCWLSR